VRTVDGRFAIVDIDAKAGAVGAHHPQAIGNRIEVDRRHGAGLERLRHLAFHRGLARLDIDGEDRAVCRDTVEHAVGRTNIDARQRAGTFDIDLRCHLAARRVDGDDRLAVDQTDNPAGCLGAGGGESGCSKHARKREYFHLPEHVSLP